MKKIALWFFALMLTGCAQMNMVGPGNVTVKNQIAVKLDSRWNQYAGPGANQSYEVWTSEGLLLDQLRFYPGIAVGQQLEVPPAGAKKTDTEVLLVRPGLNAEQIAQLIEATYARQGGLFKTLRLAPAKIMGGDGMRMEFSYVSTQRPAEVRGIAYGLMQNNKLYVMSFYAPKIHYFAKLSASAEAAMQSASIVR
jgi:hypothetical protein